MKLTGVAAIGAAILLMASHSAQSAQLYENWNTAACGFTDRATFQVPYPTRVTAVELWYRWRPNETEVGFVLLHDGREIRHGRLMRAGCDPYQESWCEARGNIGVDLPPGTAEVAVARPRVCQNAGSGGEGFIKVFGN